MPPKPQHYHQEYDLQTPPDTLWTLIADTNRFNAAMGSNEPARMPDADQQNARLRFRFKAGGMLLEYIQQPYEWVRPHVYSVVREHLRGPYLRTELRMRLLPGAAGGTRLVFDATVQPRHLVGAWFARLGYGVVGAKRTRETVRQFDTLAQAQTLPVAVMPPLKLDGERHLKLDALRARLLDTNVDARAANRLVDLVEQGDDIVLERIRPYALADDWNLPRSVVLQACLYATRIGLLDLRWDLLCPLCRGAKYSSDHLSGVQKVVHCDTCKIDFEINFERSVELTFHPNAAVREVRATEYCVAGPQVTPHIVVQQLLAPGEQRQVQPLLQPGRYRVRAINLRGGQFLRVAADGAPQMPLRLVDEAYWSPDETVIGTTPTLALRNDSGAEQLFVLEHTEWSDQAVIAADVTTLQTFRDLFSSEALRPGEQISVGSLTIVFTDLRGSTRLYRQIGDAPAFGVVMNHFDVLRRAVSEHQGTLVKTIGDAVMAAFRRPENAVRAMLQAQRELLTQAGSHPVILKTGIHMGACIAVTLNERLDYFGTTVNIAARLEGLSQGNDLILSQAVAAVPAVAALLTQEPGVQTEPFRTTLKGFDEDVFEVLRVAVKPPVYPPQPEAWNEAAQLLQG